MSLSITGGVSSAVSSALQGINASIASFDQDAQAIASGDVGDVAAAVVDASQQNVLAELNAQVLAMSEKTLGSLLDVLA